MATNDHIVIALLGDVMLGRKVGERLESDGPDALFSEELIAVLAEVDAVFANLECCISARGERWPDPSKPFFFRAPPIAVEALQRLGVTVVTLANNHALDYGYDALLDTLAALADAGIATTGAGGAAADARRPARVVVGKTTISVIGCTDHPPEYAATPSRPGVAYAELGTTIDDWLVATAATEGVAGDCVFLTPHWGPNMTGAPIHRVRRAATALRASGATIVAGHSAHVFHGVADRVIFDLGDFVDDYATHPDLRNDLGIVVLLELHNGEPVRASVLPIALDYCHTRLAGADETDWIHARFTAACAALGTRTYEDRGRLVVDLPPGFVSR